MAQWEEKHTDLRRLSFMPVSTCVIVDRLPTLIMTFVQFLLLVVVRIKRDNIRKSGLKRTTHFQI